MLTFFVGKGGVGKTTVSAAYAIDSALKKSRQRVLLISTDPAHSLADVFDTRLDDQPRSIRLTSRVGLKVWQVNAEKLFRAFIGKHKKQILSILETGSIFSRQDIEPLLDTTLPGMAEMSALLAIHDAFTSGEYDQIVVDTAPIGHTLRLFALPEDFNRFLDFMELAASRDSILAAHFGGTSKLPASHLVNEWREMVDRLNQAMRQHAELFLVTSPERFSVNESLRAKDALLAYSPPLKIAAVVLNRVVKRRGKCKTCAGKARASQAAQATLKREFPRRTIYIGEDSGAPVVGVAGLKAFAAQVFEGKNLRWSPASRAIGELRLKRVKWPLLDTDLTLVLGKGGVGKTTVSAAVGFHERQHSPATVEICSVDPAPSLDDVFETGISDQPSAVLGDVKYRASELDAVSIYRQWAGEMKRAVNEAMTAERSSVHIDLWFERQLFTTLLDSVPPGLDEVMAIFRIMELSTHKAGRVIIDMAPTGHALELLRTPDRILSWTRLLLKTLAHHRTLAVVQDAAVKVAEVGHRVRELLQLLRNPDATRFYAVMLPEALPDRETERLLAGLAVLDVKAAAIFVNRVIFPKDMNDCARCRRAHRWQLATLRKMADLEQKVYVVRNFPTEIAGKRRLRAFTGELWQLA